jgi:hypothetical protein
MTSEQREKYILFDPVRLVKNRLVPITPTRQQTGNVANRITHLPIRVVAGLATHCD